MINFRYYRDEGSTFNNNCVRQELTKTVVLEQKEINERRLKTVLEEQTELYARIMSEQVSYVLLKICFIEILMMAAVKL